MPTLLERLFGVPVTRQEQREAIDAHLNLRGAAGLRSALSDNISHVTQKSGALLSAQAIFLVVDTYGGDHGWAREAVIVSIVTMVLAALIVMVNLRTVYLGVIVGIDDPDEMERAALLQLGRLSSSRGLRFNIALYLTFLSVILLGFGAFEAALS
jgi:hypothetical protein